MPISVPGLLLSKALVEQEDIPEERQRQLMLIGGAAPFPLGVVIAQLIARREAPSAAADRAETTGADGQVGRAAALAAARAEASAAAAAAESAGAAADAAQSAAASAARAASGATESAMDAARVAAAIEQEWEEEKAPKKK
jgi:hypothetical protein